MCIDGAGESTIYMYVCIYVNMYMYEYMHLYMVFTWFHTLFSPARPLCWVDLYTYTYVYVYAYVYIGAREIYLCVVFS